jgi:hypothetical protein
MNIKNITKVSVIAACAVSALMLTGCDSDATEGIYAQMLTAQTSVSYTTKQLTGYISNGTGSSFLSLEDTGIYKVTEGTTTDADTLISTPNNSVVRTKIIKSVHTLDNGTKQQIASIYSPEDEGIFELYYILGNSGDIDVEDATADSRHAKLYRYSSSSSSTDPLTAGTALSNPTDYNYYPQYFTANNYLVGLKNTTYETDKEETEQYVTEKTLALLDASTFDSSDTEIGWDTIDSDKLLPIDTDGGYGLSSVVPVLDATQETTYATDTPFVVTIADSNTDEHYYSFYLYDSTSGFSSELNSEGGDGTDDAIEYDLVSAAETGDGTIIGVLKNGDMVYISDTTVKEFDPGANSSFTYGGPRPSFLINNDDEAYLIIMDTSSDMIVYKFSSSSAPTSKTSKSGVSISCVTNGYASDLSGTDEISSFIKLDTKKYVVATTSCGYYTITFSDDPTDGDGTGYASVEGIDFSE